MVVWNLRLPCACVCNCLLHWMLYSPHLWITSGAYVRSSHIPRSARLTRKMCSLWGASSSKGVCVTQYLGTPTKSSLSCAPSGIDISVHILALVTARVSQFNGNPGKCVHLLCVIIHRGCCLYILRSRLVCSSTNILRVFSSPSCSSLAISGITPYVTAHGFFAVISCTYPSSPVMARIAYLRQSG